MLVVCLRSVCILKAIIMIDVLYIVLHLILTFFLCLILMFVLFHLFRYASFNYLITFNPHRHPVR